jgi:hypothetical protein
VGLIGWFDGEEDFPKGGIRRTEMSEGVFPIEGFDDEGISLSVADREEGDLDRGKFPGVPGGREDCPVLPE